MVTGDALLPLTVITLGVGALYGLLQFDVGLVPGVTVMVHVCPAANELPQVVEADVGVVPDGKLP